MFVTVRIVAPAPTSPPKNPQIEFPMPCPINSLFELCLVLVKESATKEVRSESIAPSKDKVKA